MYIGSERLFTNVKPSSWIGKIIQFPLIRILIAGLFVLLMFLLHNLTVVHVIEKLSEPYFTYFMYIDTIIGFGLLLLGYRLYTRFIENRIAYELTLMKSHAEFALGFAIGMSLVVVMVIILSVFGYYKVDSFNSWRIIIDSLFFFGIGAFLQELVFRVVLFKLTEELLGSWLAFLSIALIFGGAHIGNDNATIWTSLAIAVGDVLLTAAYIYTRRIWLVFGIHFSWNYFQDGIFGMPNSGITQFDSWINSTVNGYEWITGGSFGIEASYIAVLMSLGVGIIILKKAIDKNQIVLPIWKRR